MMFLMDINVVVYVRIAENRSMQETDTKVLTTLNYHILLIKKETNAKELMKLCFTYSQKKCSLIQGK